jgi:hypothetical protein
MEKISIGPKEVMKGLSKGEVAEVNFLSLPKPVETNFPTGYNVDGEKVEGGNAKWEMKINLLNHPNGSSGEMVWQTTAEVVRVDLFGFVSDDEKQMSKAFKDLSNTFHFIYQTQSGTHVCNYDPRLE